MSSTKDPERTLTQSPVQGCPVLAPEDASLTFQRGCQASSPAHGYPQPVMYQPGTQASSPAHGYLPPVMYQPGNQASSPAHGYPAAPVDQTAMYQGYQASYQFPQVSSSPQNLPAQTPEPYQGYNHPSRMMAVVVTGPQYSLPHETTFAISRKVISLSRGDWTITDAAGHKVFKVDGRLFSIRARKYLRDAAGHEILRMQKKIFTVHEGWFVYAHNNQLLGTVKRTTPSRISPQLIPSMDVFLASNTNEVVADFQLKGSFFERSLTLLCRGQVLAQARQRFTRMNLYFGNESFGVTVFPGVDHAFVLALIVIMDSVYLHSHHHPKNQQQSAAKGTKNLFPVGGCSM